MLRLNNNNNNNNVVPTLFGRKLRRGFLHYCLRLLSTYCSYPQYHSWITFATARWQQAFYLLYMPAQNCMHISITVPHIPNYELSHSRHLFKATSHTRVTVAHVDSRRQHRGLFGVQPTPVWPCKQPFRVVLHSTVHCLQTDLVRISVRLLHEKTHSSSLCMEW